MAADEKNQLHHVVINHEQQHSVWPADKEPPAGWSTVGFTGTLDECLTHVDQVWTDLRPRDLRSRDAQRPSAVESS
ncbi:MbtH family protein [Streptomyces sp. NPDC052114]|uniref:MbtH family protein n=1 Tax=unclassified Streptomyces TaxID=2593676 RepID=UPI003419FED8